MLDKLHKQHSSNPHYIKPKSQSMKAFGIIHFAGTVYYHADNFLEKNRDTFSADLFDLLHDTKSKFLEGLFQGQRAMVRTCSLTQTSSTDDLCVCLTDV